MGFWDFLSLNDSRLPASGAGLSYSWHSPNVQYLGAREWEERVLEATDRIRGLSPAQLWRTQPHLRTVVGFVARNVAQLGVHLYDRVNDTDRQRNRTNDLSRALANPGDGMSTYDLIFSLVGDKMLYDRAYWLPWTDAAGLPRLRRLPPAWVQPGKRDSFGTLTYKISYRDDANPVELSADRLIVFGGYSPLTLDGCSPPLEALKDTLAEQVESTLYRSQVWKRGGRVSSVIKRPADAPPWTDEQANRFREDWYANFTGNGARSGGTPILEDGMTIEKLDFSALDMQWAEGQRLSLNTVAAVYYVNPTMVGNLEGANYSNVREFRRMLYGDTLGPYIAEFEGVINTFALPMFGLDPAISYCEFNIQEKLQGSFEEQAAILSSATGRPWMTTNEARARMNLPWIEGGDELVTPLNVTEGGLASPRDTGEQNEDPFAEDPDQAKSRILLVRTKSRATPDEEDRVARVVKAFFKRQESAVRSRLGSKADEDWWDEDRWNDELAADLFQIATKVAASVATNTLRTIGFSPDEYDAERTYAWLEEVSRRSSEGINAKTRELIAAALEADSPDDAVDSVFSQGDSRATMVAVSTATLLSGFAAVEATKQVAGEDRATKTWITGTNPRPDHADLDGETVLLSENFSNGAAWPGDGSALGAEDLANCNCELEINIPLGEDS